MRDIPPALVDAITSALVEADAAGEIAIAVTTPTQIAERIGEKVREVFVGDIFTPEELMALSVLIFHATADKRFYDWEMPTLIGYTAEEMEALGRKIRALTAL